ncbi:nuclear transport factor 2 family protein [Novosphingobium sp. G106]|uniref:nuclear transport factor 2 family protein n=1 Tax=Novosphingobium sp. G106 TaxID=2849500 RepID=UPI001C2D1348|nr:nuclear transport factor 2 family protein [Novosphingobium sp. G106]MBV1689507.1 nuclear transport factor 2 family protein [Novosphingobium sp. G106]
MAYGIDYLLENFALEQAVLKYCTAVDKLDDLDFMMTNFTEDAVLDLTGLELPRFEGHEQIRGFYTQVFADVSHHMHVLTNFRTVKLEGDDAQIHAYVTGMGRSKAGIDMQVFVYYDLDMRKVDGTWKIGRFYEAPQLPMPESVAQVHKKN